MKEIVAQTLIERLSPGMCYALKRAGTTNLSSTAGLLCLEVRPAYETDTLLDKILKFCCVDLIHKQMDGRSGWLVFSATENSQLTAAADLIANETERSIQSTQITSSTVVSAISEEHAQQINRQHKRVLVKPGSGLLTIDCRPAVSALAIANEAEKSLACQVLQLKFLGSSGRVVLAGASDTLQCWTAPSMEAAWNR